MRIFQLKFLIFLLYLLPVKNSKADVVVIPDTLDFKYINESDGKVEGVFNIINSSDSTLIIQKVLSTCGCTTANLTKSSLQPGENTELRMTFDPSGRPGHFDKSIKIYINKGAPLKLNFKGIVIPTRETLSKRYPVKVDILRFETDTLKLGELPKGSRRHAFIAVYNESNEIIQPVFQTDQKGLSLNLSPKHLLPYEAATLSLYIDTSKIAGDGFKNLKIQGKWGDKEDNTIDIILSLIILPEKSLLMKNSTVK